MKLTKIFLVGVCFSCCNLLFAGTVATSKESSLSSNNLKYEQGNLQKAPETQTGEYFESELMQKKYPLKLEWSGVEQAEFYEVEITRARSCSRRYFKTSKNGLDIMVFPNARYLWRVTAYSQDSILTEYSPKYKLYVKTPLGDHIISKVEEPYPSKDSRDVASEQESTICKYQTAEALHQNITEDQTDKPKELTNITENTTEEEPVAAIQKEEKVIDRVPAYSYANKYSLWGRSWIKGGASFNGYFHNQDILSGNEITHETISSPAFYGEFGTFIGSKFGLVISGNLSGGEFEDESGALNESYTTQRITADAIYLLGSDWKTTKSSQFHLKFGVGYASNPLIETVSASNTFAMVDSKIISVRAGIGYKNKFTNKFRPELGLSVAYPVSFSTSGSTLDLDSGFSVDFTAGINYQLYKNYQIGLFWQTEALNLDYTQQDSANTIDGSAFIINNHLGVYLGLEF